MKKLTRRSFTAAGIIAALGVGSVFAASSNLVGCVYGPPQEQQEDPENKEYKPEENEPESVYGPPEDLGWELDDPGADNYDPAENELVDVYGPPPGE